MKISENIRTLRLMMGMSQKDFGKLIGKSDSQIADYEHGRCDIPVSVVYSIAEKANADIAWLMTGERKERPKYDAQFRVYNEADRKLIVPILVANGYDVGQHKQNRTETGKTVDYYIHINESSDNVNSCRKL